MPDVVMYSLAFCPYCEQARRILDAKGATFQEIDSAEIGGRNGLRQRFGPDWITYPQVVIGDRHVGGASELARLDASGELDELLAAGDERRPPSSA